MSEPTKTQVACNAIRDMFFHKHYNGIVPAKDMEVVKNGKQWHARFGKKAIHDAIKELASEGYMTLDGAKENWIWGFPGMNQTLFDNNLIHDICKRKERGIIHDIGKRKERGIEPTVNEKEEIKTFAKSHIELIKRFGEDNSGDDKLSLMKKILELFPHEVKYVVDEAGL